MTWHGGSLLAMTVVLLLASASVRVAADQSTPCADFLAQLHKKPAHLEFLGCKHQGDGEGDSWIANYRVRGGHAAEVEQYLVQHFKLKMLRKSCCLWDGPTAHYRRKGQHFDISMTSDEETSATAKRADWGKIPFFYVTVDFYTNEGPN